MTIDLRDMKYMPLQIERLRQSKAWKECGHEPELAFYLWNLWMTAWHDSVPCGSLPDDERELRLAADADEKAWRRLRVKLMRNWTKGEDGRLYHPVVVEIAAEVDRKRAKWREDKQRNRGGQTGGHGGGQTGQSTARSRGQGAESTKTASGQRRVSSEKPVEAPVSKVSLSPPYPPVEPSGEPPAPEGRGSPTQQTVTVPNLRPPSVQKRLSRKDLDAMAQAFGTGRPQSPMEAQAEKARLAKPISAGPDSAV